MLFDGLGYPVDRNTDGQEPEAKQHGKQDLASCRNASRDDDWDREKDEYDIDDCATDSHSKELCHALTALRSWIRNDLPVVGYWSTLSESAHNYGHKGSCKNTS